jgi:hypothetical protein
MRLGQARKQDGCEFEILPRKVRRETGAQLRREGAVRQRKIGIIALYMVQITKYDWQND